MRNRRIVGWIELILGILLILLGIDSLVFAVNLLKRWY